MTDTSTKDEGTELESDRPGDALRPGKPTMLSHVAYVTRDTAATVDFYTRILGMELVNAILDDAIPSTGEAVTYFHSFFRMADGSTVAFFEAPELPPMGPPPHPAYDTFQHLAMQVDSRQTVDRWRKWLQANEIDVLGPVDHKIIYSIYFHDPNGVRLEITTPLSPRWNDDEVGARASLGEWEAAKERARAAGLDPVTVLTELARERSRRRSS